MNKLYSNLELKTQPESRLSITASINPGDAEKYKEDILKEKMANLAIPGFRKGEAPKEIAEKHIDKDELQNEAVSMLSADALTQIIIDNDLKVIGKPNINVNTQKEPYLLQAEVTILPEVKLGDYKSIAKQHNSKPQEEVVVTQDDIDNVIKHLRLQKARMLILDKLQKENKTPTPQDLENIDADNLPELTQEDFKELGGGSETLEEFTQKVKGQIKTEKEFAETEKRRLQMLEAIIAESNIEVPKDIIDLEVRRMEEMFAQDLQAMGMQFDTYLTQIGKTIDELRESWRTPAEKRAKLQMVFDAIAQAENISPNKDKLKTEVEKYMNMYPQANKDEVYAFVSAQLSNQAVIDFLESLK